MADGSDSICFRYVFGSGVVDSNKVESVVSCGSASAGCLTDWLLNYRPDQGYCHRSELPKFVLPVSGSTCGANFENPASSNRRAVAGPRSDRNSAEDRAAGVETLHEFCGVSDCDVRPTHAFARYSTPASRLSGHSPWQRSANDHRRLAVHRRRYVQSPAKLAGALTSDIDSVVGSWCRRVTLGVE